MTTIATTPLRAPALLAWLAQRVGQAPWGVADQMLISASNMVVIVLLAWALTQDAMGGYVLVSQVLYLFNSLQDGLITQPHNVLGPRFVGEAYQRYTTSTAVAHFVLAGGFVALILAAWTVAHALRWWPAPLLLALAPATLAWQTQEFFRRVLYTEGKVGAAFLTDAIAYGGQATLVTALWWTERLTGPLALYAVAATSSVAAVVGLWRLRDSLRGLPSLSDARHNWRVGKWLAGGELAGVWLGDGALFYLAAGAMGKEAAAVLRAVHTIFGPSRVFAMVLHTMLPIRLARYLAQGGPIDMQAQVRATLLTALPLFGGFCIVTAAFAHPLLALGFGPEYAASAHVLQVYAMAMLLCYIGMVLNAALKARHATRTLFLNRLTGSTVTLGVGAALLFPLGLPGAVLGMAAGHLCVAVLNNLWLLRHRESEAHVYAGPAGAVA